MQALYNKFKHLYEDYGELIIPTSLWEHANQIKAKLLQERKDINISVFGQHNCGKSTFINALMGCL
jgi:ribosome biogenesis GTPase A